MKIFATNTIVSGDTIFAGADDPTGKPNPPAAAARFEDEVMKFRARIASFPFGAKWLDLLDGTKQSITIVPSSDRNDAVAQTDAKRLADGLAAGLSLPGNDTGTGLGAPIRVKFNPAASAGQGAGRVSGAALLMHEMTHAFRSANGRFTPVPMGPLVERQAAWQTPEWALRFPNFEEFLAVVVEDVFAAESGAQMVRMNWDILH